MTERTSTTYHVSLDVAGALRNWRAREWKGVVTDPATGRKLTPDEFKDLLLEQLAKGVRRLPYGECEGFSTDTGCPGHPTPRKEVPCTPAS